MKTRFSMLMVALVGGGGFVVGGCQSEDEANPVTGDDNEIVEGQLGGSDMAPGTYSLTFDDGPGDRTEELANWLGDRGIVATFFINGRNAPGHERALQTIVDRGHLLANHTQNHEDMTGLFGGELIAAVADTDAVIARFQPSGPWLLRAPFGAWNSRVAAEINGSSMRKYVGSIFWNAGGQLTGRHAADFACWSNGLSVEDCANRYSNEMRDRGRGIILLHDIHSRTIELTQTLVARMGAAAFVPITNAPQIAARLGVVPGGGGAGGPATCDSATLGRAVAAGTCVQRADRGQAWFVCSGNGSQDWTEIAGPEHDGCTSCPQLGSSCRVSGGGTCDSATLGTSVPTGTCVQRADRGQAWFRCEGHDSQDWIEIQGPQDGCASCPQLGSCR